MSTHIIEPSSIEPYNRHRSLTFQSLPYDVRHMIWTLCLPHRVFDLDLVIAEFCWAEECDTDENGTWVIPPPCSMAQTIFDNSRPPLIAQVCRESRAIAFRACAPPPTRRHGRAYGVHWDGSIQPCPWTDRVRDSPHLYYDDAYAFRYYDSHPGPDPVVALAAASDYFSKCGSLMLACLWKASSGDVPDDPDRPTANDPPITFPIPPGALNTDARAVYENTQTLMQHSTWRVVMKVVVIHSGFRDAAATGHFSLLGDAPIQIVDCTDEKTVADLYAMAATCEQKHGATAKQDFTITPAEVMNRRLKYVLWSNGYPDVLNQTMRPAIMFRLCTAPCNVQTGDPVRGIFTSAAYWG